jgi:flavin reductase (DIM6/NTAB) family NADH-FMN oxidoreductase RutF
MKLTPVDYASMVPDLMAQAAKPGLLLVVPDTRRPANVMTIGWALWGQIWGKPMAMVLVRPSRYSFDLINRAGVFTVCRMPAGFDKAVLRCGTVSGRDVDKVAEQGWHTATAETQPVPYLVEAALHVECHTVLTAQVTDKLAQPFLKGYYPQGDLHTMYIGEMTGVFKHEA